MKSKLSGKQGDRLCYRRTSNLEDHHDRLEEILGL